MDVDEGEDYHRLMHFLDTIHFIGPGWPALDTLPPHPDGRPGWDTPESAVDPDDEEEDDDDGD